MIKTFRLIGLKGQNNWIDFWRAYLFLRTIQRKIKMKVFLYSYKIPRYLFALVSLVWKMSSFPAFGSTVTVVAPTFCTSWPQTSNSQMQHINSYFKELTSELSFFFCLVFCPGVFSGSINPSSKRWLIKGFISRINQNDLEKSNHIEKRFALFYSSSFLSSYRVTLIGTSNVRKPFVQLTRKRLALQN